MHSPWLWLTHDCSYVTMVKLRRVLGIGARNKTQSESEMAVLDQSARGGEEGPGALNKTQGRGTTHTAAPSIDENDGQ
jgi:hypothetical protein